MMRNLLPLLLGLLLSACTTEEPPAAPPDPAAETVSLGAQPARLPMHLKVVLAADPWCPHNCEAGGASDGYMIDIAREAFADYGIAVEYQNMSWARALQQARVGRIDGVVGAFIGDAPDFIFPEEASGYSRTYLFTHPDSNWTYTGLASLSDQSLVALNGYSYSPELDPYIEQHQDDAGRVWILSGPSPLDRAIKLVLEGRADVLPEDLDVMNWTLSREFGETRLRPVGPIHASPIYIAFSPANERSADYARILSEGIRKLRASGRLEQLLSRYGVSWPVD